MNVYILKQGDYYKIGKAKDIYKRMKQLQTAAPLKIEYIASLNCNNCESSLTVENEIHLRYNQFKSYGEWFKLNKTQIKTIIDKYEFQICPILSTLNTNQNEVLRDTFIRMLNLQIYRYFKINKETIDENTFSTVIEEIKTNYKDLSYHIFNLGESWKNQTLVNKCFYEEKLNHKEINYIKSIKSKESDTSIPEYLWDFCKLIYKYLNIQDYIIGYDKFIKYIYLLQQLCFDEKTGYYDQKQFEQFITIKDEKLIKYLDSYDYNSRTKKHYLNKIKMLYEDTI